MKISTKARYAIMAMLELASSYAAEGASVLPLVSIAKNQHLPLPYLEQIFSKLRAFGLLSSVRGASGGFALASKPSLISIYSIIDAVDQPVKTTRCANDGIGCGPSGVLCNTHFLWVDLGRTIEHFLQKTTLQDVLDQQKARPILEVM
jgi:Rrf2 family iron-sulfur cluster assembly transcriptional regulator